jgi:hypothetical protein
MNKIVLVVLTLSLMGCLATAHTIKDFDAFAPDPTMKMSDHPPKADQVRKSRTSVEITMFDDSKIEKRTIARKLITESNLVSVMTDSVEQSLVGAVNVINTSNEQKKDFLKILKKCELEGNCKFSGDKLLDYAVMGSINSVDVVGEFIRAHKAKNIFTGKEYTVPNKCKYNVTVSGSIKIYSFPNVELVSSLPIRRSMLQSMDANYSAQCSNLNSNAIALTRKAGQKAIEDISTKLKNQMAPKGYIVERRFKENGSKKTYIFRLSLGTNMGLKEGDEVKIYSLETLSDKLLGREIISKRIIALGKVTNQLGEQYSWIVIDDPAKAEKIRMGDFVTIMHPEGFNVFFNQLMSN